MADTVAEGSIVLTVDSSRVASGMRAAAAKAKAGQSEIAKSFKDSSKEKLGEIFGGGSLIGMGAKAGAAGAVVAGIAAIGKEIYEFHQNTLAFERDLEQQAKGVNEWASKVTAGIDSAKERIAELEEIAGTTEGIKKYGEELGKVDSAVATLEGRLRQLTETEEGLDSKWNSIGNMELYVRGKFAGTQAAAKQQRQDIEKELDAAKKTQEELNRQFARNQNALINPKAQAELKAFIRQIKEDTKDIFGRTADDKAVDKLKDKFGFSEAQLGAVRMELLAKNTAIAEKEIADLMRLTTELSTGIKRSAEEERVLEMQRQGIVDETINRYIDLVNLKNELEKPPKQYSPLKALEKGTWDAISFENKNKFDNAEKTKKDELKKLDVIAAAVDRVREAIEKIPNPSLI